MADKKVYLFHPVSYPQKGERWNINCDMDDIRDDTVNGSEIRRSPVELGSLSHYLPGLIHPKWCRISSINSMSIRYDIRNLVMWEGPSTIRKGRCEQL